MVHLRSKSIHWVEVVECAKGELELRHMLKEGKLLLWCELEVRDHPLRQCCLLLLDSLGLPWISLLIWISGQHLQRGNMLWRRIVGSSVLGLHESIRGMTW